MHRPRYDVRRRAETSALLEEFGAGIEDRFQIIGVHASKMWIPASDVTVIVEVDCYPFGYGTERRCEGALNGDDTVIRMISPKVSARNSKAVIAVSLCALCGRIV
jgi:hypothetical protein